ncbi:MAG: TerC family protein [Alphaproteobacteria bacterium]|jgi:predicted tellurium resistance membrane protein TerC|nr:TerC family protein [Alphaproteobacteria bacterium]
MEFLTNPEVWAAFLTLTALEIVLGVDNIVFIAILAGRLPKEDRAAARQIGLAVALGTRLALLATLFYLSHLETKTGIEIFGRDLSWRDLVLGGGGMFLIWKAIVEMNEAIRPHKVKRKDGKVQGARSAFAWIIVQIAIIDIVFSIDSVITAVGIANEIEIMATAIIIAVFVMMVAINPISSFIDTHKEVKIVALSFLLLVGFILVAEAMGTPIPKGYLYFALGFASLIQGLVLWAQSSERQMDTLAANSERADREDQAH